MKTFLVSILLLASTVFFAQSKVLKASKDEFRITAAYVDYVEHIKDQNLDAKIFSVSGGDPVMNGALLNLAVFINLEEGWNVYELANVRDYKLLKSAKKGYIKIKLVRDTFDSDENIIQVKSIMYINLSQIKKGSIEVEEK
jgi:hypothetical protein